MIIFYCTQTLVGIICKLFNYFRRSIYRFLFLIKPLSKAKKKKKSFAYKLIPRNSVLSQNTSLATKTDYNQFASISFHKAI